MGLSMDGWIEGPGLPQSVWRYKWLVGGLVLLGILTASLLSAAQPTRYEGVVRIYLTAEESASNYPERIVMSHAQFIESPAVSDRVISLSGNRLTGKELERQLTVEPSADGDFITIRARDTTPSNAAELADAVYLAYRQIVSEQRKAAANGTIAALQGVQRSLASELAQINEQQRTDNSPALQAEEQAKKRQMAATANQIEKISSEAAGTAVPPPALEDKAAVPDEPVQPKPLRAAVVGAVVGLVIGVALAWLLAARRRVRRREGASESQAHVVDGRMESAPPALQESNVGASEIQAPSEQVRQLADVGQNRASESIDQAVNSLDEDPDLLYSLAEWLESQHQNFPQVTAERLRDRLLFDKVAVLLKTDGGLDLAGCVGWHADGVNPVRQDERRILNKLGGNGVRRIGSADRRALVNAGLIGNEPQTIVVAPLKHENVAFGFLLVGQEESDSGGPPVNGGLDGIGSFARSVAPDLHAWLLLHKLQQQLASHGRGHEQIKSAVKSKPLAGKSATTAAESELPARKSGPPAAKSESPAQKSGPSTAEAAAPTAKSEPPAQKSGPSTAEAAAPTAKSQAASQKSGPPAAGSELRTARPASARAESEPPAGKPAKAAAQPERSARKSAPPSPKPAPPAPKPAPPTAEAEPAAANSAPAAAQLEPSEAESEPPFAWPTYPTESQPPSAA
jgi:capsular polysaccharide biosynthesis protein